MQNYNADERLIYADDMIFLMANINTPKCIVVLKIKCNKLK